MSMTRVLSPVLNKIWWFRSHPPSVNTIDEIDNRTNDRPAFNSIFVMSQVYCFEMERLKTFDEWPINYIHKDVLARTGMFYTRESDKVKCYFCTVEIGRWEESDNPVSEHIKWSPNCPLLRRGMTNNVPINADALETILPPTSYDVYGSNVLTELRPTASPESSISSSSALTSSPSVSSRYQMAYPEFAIEAVRYRSFAEWPRTMKQRPQELAEAGFFYASIGDRVNCFSCGGGLKGWDENDEPWEQHAQWWGKCRFLKLMKGQAYIDAVIAKYKLAADTIQEDLSAPSDVGEVQECGIQTEGQQQNNCLITTTLAVDLLQRSDSNSLTEKRTIREEKLCKICYTAEYNTAFLPCGHVVACVKCASSVTKCPMCRKPFTDLMRVYFS